MLFVTFSFSFMLLFQGHVACSNFTLTGPHNKMIYGNLFNYFLNSLGSVRLVVKFTPKCKYIIIKLQLFNSAKLLLSSVPSFLPYFRISCNFLNLFLLFACWTFQ